MNYKEISADEYEKLLLKYMIIILILRFIALKIKKIKLNYKMLLIKLIKMKILINNIKNL